MSGGQTWLSDIEVPAAVIAVDAVPTAVAAPLLDAALFAAAADDEAATAEKLDGGKVGELFDLNKSDCGLMLLLAEEAEEEKAWLE